MILYGNVGLSQVDTITEKAIRISFSDEYSLPEDDRKNNHGYMVLVEAKNNIITLDGNAYSVVYPPYMDPDSLAFAVNYFSGGVYGITNKSLPHLIYPYQSPKPKIFIDTSYQFNFLNALNFESSSLHSRWVTRIPNANYEECIFVMQYEKADWKNQVQREKLTPLFANSDPLSKSNNAVSPDHWMKDKRRNFKFAEFKYNEINYRIGIYDYSANGQFNNLEDRILFNTADSTLSENLSADGYVYKPNLYIEANNQAFQVVDLEMCGKSITLLPINTKDNIEELKVGTKLEDLVSAIIVGDSLDLRRFKFEKNFTIIDVWGSWCEPCLLAFDELKKVYSKYNMQIEIIGLNFGDPNSYITQLETEHGIPWRNYSISPAALKRLNVDSFPTYILLSGTGEMLTFSNDLTQIMAVVSRR